jgi:hypothetical protein
MSILTCSWDQVHKHVAASQRHVVLWVIVEHVRGFAAFSNCTIDKFCPTHALVFLESWVLGISNALFLESWVLGISHALFLDSWVLGIHHMPFMVVKSRELSKESVQSIKEYHDLCVDLTSNL